MVMRRNGVTDITTAGSNTIRVREMAICIGTLSVEPEAVIPPAGDGAAAARAAQALELKNRVRRMVRDI